jgi:CheY-like chemotaxis protein
MSHPVETILLVDDEETVRRFGARVLARHGYHIVSADSAEDALRAAHARGDAIDLHITDVMMPGMNGRQLAERLLARKPSLRVLFISGYAEDVLGTSVGFVPGTAFLGKPFKPKALVTKVREVLGMEQSP